MWRPGTEVPILTKHTGNVKGFDLRIRPVCSVSCDLVLFGRDADRHTKDQSMKGMVKNKREVQGRDETRRFLVSGDEGIERIWRNRRKGTVVPTSKHKSGSPGCECTWRPAHTWDRPTDPRLCAPVSWTRHEVSGSAGADVSLEGAVQNAGE